MPFIYSEDAALKMKLQGLTVTDANAPPGGRAVPVRFRLPQDELANLSYPIIIIEHGEFYPDPEREHRGFIQLPYAPEGFAPWYSGPGNADVANSPYYADFPMPYTFNYVVTVYTRFMGVHMRPLVAQLLTEPYLPAKFGFLNVPQDGTVRSMFLVGGPDESYGQDEDGKRLLKTTFLIQVYSELVQNVQSTQAFGGTLVPVSTVDLDLSVYSDLGSISMNTPAEIEANRGILSVGVGSSFNALEPPTG